MSAVRVSADVDPADVLRATSDADLVAECRARGLSPDPADALDDATDDDLLDECDARGFGGIYCDAEELADDLRAAFLARDRAHFEVLLSRLAPAPALPEKAFRREARA